MCQTAGPKVVFLCLRDNLAEPLVEEALRLEVIGGFSKAEGTAWIFLKSGGVTTIDEDVRAVGTLSLHGSHGIEDGSKGLPSVQQAETWWLDYSPQITPLIDQNIFMVDSSRDHFPQINRFTYDSVAALALAIDQGLSRAAAQPG